MAYSFGVVPAQGDDIPSYGSVVSGQAGPYPNPITDGYPIPIILDDQLLDDIIVDDETRKVPSNVMVYCYARDQKGDDPRDYAVCHPMTFALVDKIFVTEMLNLMGQSK